jgi:hypothetical protein
MLKSRGSWFKASLDKKSLEEPTSKEKFGCGGVNLSFQLK